MFSDHATRLCSYRYLGKLQRMMYDTFIIDRSGSKDMSCSLTTPLACSESNLVSECLGDHVAVARICALLLRGIQTIIFERLFADVA
jgi:hypothetical protein